MRRFRRTGTVTAVRLDAAREWATAGGDALHGDACDWLITSPDGGLRTAKDEQFRSTYALVVGDTWQRIGEVDAHQVTEAMPVDTLEGRVTAEPGDWVVVADDGTSWPVPDRVFRSTYEPIG